MSAAIIVGYNGTGSAGEAVMWAAAEAHVRRVALRIVTSFELPALATESALGWGAGEAFEAARQTAVANIGGVEAAVRAAHPVVDVTTRVCAGPATKDLLHEVGPDDLLVVGASEHRGPAAFWLGTTPRHLVRHSPCPVAVIRGSASRGGPDRVVVGVDGSAASDRAVMWAGDEADRHNVELLVVHGWTYPYVAAYTAFEQARDLARIDAEGTLERSVGLVRERCGANVLGLLVDGGPATALLDSVRDGDLLVVGSRGRGAIRSRLFGSTANSILDAASVPVVVVRSAAEDDAASIAAQRPAVAELARVR
ncbi:MAG: hypothetical protein JWM12_303 [Ilumatobacteraceae bacterium]|nr:hypothetical protein [Ilumatobacteraceae bacterium]